MSKTLEELAEQYVKAEWDRSAKGVCLEYCRWDFLAGYKAAQDKVMNSSNNSNGWISVKDRLPEENQEVLISYGQKPFFLIAFLYHPNHPKKDVKMFCGKNNRNYSLDYVTHWMPLPAPPKEEKLITSLDQIHRPQKRISVEEAREMFPDKPPKEEK